MKELTYTPIRVDDPPELCDPMLDRALVKLDMEFEDNLSAGGIIIPDTTEQIVAATGTVVRIGEECARLAPGDRVLLLKHAGIRVPVPEDRKSEEKSWVIITEPECLCRWPGAAYRDSEAEPSEEGEEEGA